MKATSLPPSVKAVLDCSDSPSQKLNNLLAALGEVLQVDRCFLYVRHPDLEIGKIEFCWRKDETIPDVPETKWENDTRTLPKEDPLFAAALGAKPSVYVEDVETAPPTVLNREFEAKTFGHRALIHAHLTQKEQLWGILQPCVFGKPRAWSLVDKSLLEAVIPEVTPLVMGHVKALNLEKGQTNQADRATGSN